MKVFADASFLYNAYYPAQAFSSLARRLRHRKDLRINASVAVVLEFRIGALWDAKNEEGWNEFQRDTELEKIKEVAVDWDKLFSEFEHSALRYGKTAQPRLIDGLHVIAARQTGATHFLSFDHRSRQRAFARAMGLKVLPERLPGEF